MIVALPRIARGPAAYETAEVLLLHGPMYGIMYVYYFNTKKTTNQHSANDWRVKPSRVFVGRIIRIVLCHFPTYESIIKVWIRYQIKVAVIK